MNMTTPLRLRADWQKAMLYMIKLSHVYKEYNISGEIFTALSDISLTISKGDYVGIIGPSGSGKSTLMHIIGLLDLPTKGTVTINDRDISGLADDDLSTLRSEFVGFVFQQFNLINKMSVLENIMLPTIYARKKLTFNPRERAMSIVQRFGLTGKERSYPNKISGGQQQRVAIARALMMNPELILADEPTGNLDTKTGNAILDILEDLNRTGNVTVVIITHEPDVAARTKRKINILDGKIVTRTGNRP
jgi:ABC-type lipoprotein export system ATPase subunit